ncbi:hypothetical protein ACFV7Q_24625 [Streptomyces sp. NPDC059851]|uniref:hypothetical protein n=1 Tax=Streptomyces sp. NPDC059851 TaxID=3346971 RepID=UPI0036521E3D
MHRVEDLGGLGRPEAVRVTGRGEPLVGEVDLLLLVLGEVGDRGALVAAPVDGFVGLGVDDVRVDGGQGGEVLRLRDGIRRGRNPLPLGVAAAADGLPAGTGAAELPGAGGAVVAARSAVSSSLPQAVSRAAVERRSPAG